VGLVKGYLSDRGYSLEALAELYDVLPLDIKLNFIMYDKKGTFQLKGTAKSMSTVFSFVSNMESSKYFKEVKTRHTTKRKEGSKDVTDFEIICLIAKGAS
jgi:Tfp pilus assembly protein PilN